MTDPDSNPLTSYSSADDFLDAMDDDDFFSPEPQFESDDQDDGFYASINDDDGDGLPF